MISGRAARSDLSKRTRSKRLEAGRRTSRAKRNEPTPRAGGCEELRRRARSRPQGIRQQARLLVENLHHPSLRAQKYDESEDLWQARVNRWRFYFNIAGDTCVIRDIIPHPK